MNGFNFQAKLKKPLKFHLAFLSILLMVFIVSIDATALAVVIPVSLFTARRTRRGRVECFELIRRLDYNGRIQRNVFAGLLGKRFFPFRRDSCFAGIHWSI
jgi:hypothetical protein